MNSKTEFINYQSLGSSKALLDKKPTIFEKLSFKINTLTLKDISIKFIKSHFKTPSSIEKPLSILNTTILIEWQPPKKTSEMSTRKTEMMEKQRSCYLWPPTCTIKSCSTLCVKLEINQKIQQLKKGKTIHTLIPSTASES